MQIPAKIQHGEKVISTVFDKINGIIDYLNASRIRKGPGILVDESPSGTLVKLDPRARGTTIQQIITGGTASATPQEITATVDGGTASISLTGGTNSVNMVGAGSVSISENESGEIVFSGSGSGAYPYQPIDGPIMNEDTDYYFSQDTWISGLLETLSAGSGKLGYGYIDLNIGVKTRRIFYSLGAIDLSIPFSILIHAGTTVRLICEGDASAVLYYQYD